MRCKCLTGADPSEQIPGAKAHDIVISAQGLVGGSSGNTISGGSDDPEGGSRDDVLSGDAGCNVATGGLSSNRSAVRRDAEVCDGLLV